MTTSGRQEIDRRTGPRRPKTAAQYFSAEWQAEGLADGYGKDSESWPSSRYRADPVGFAREVVGIEPWGKQVEVLEAVRDNPRVAVASGHKVSKSNTDAIVALWFFCCFEQARVVMSSVTARQVDRILWREVRMMHARARRGLPTGDDAYQRNPDLRTQDIGGEPAILARSGLSSPDFREIVGFTAKEAEAVAGVSGKNLLYIIDEASGVPADIFEAIEGNRAGGARILLTSNPTQPEGEFFEAFHAKKKTIANPTGYHTVQISSEETPNAVAGRVIIPGLATREWIEEKRIEWGEDSPLYKVRVKGEFVLKEDHKIISLHAIRLAEMQWEDTEPAADDVLHVGLDPAGPGGKGDESIFCFRRGKKVLALSAARGLTEEGHLVHLLGLLREHRRPRERAVVVIDREGPVGSRVWAIIRAYADGQREPTFTVVAVLSSLPAVREPNLYDRVRDELWACSAAWFKNGGTIPEDPRLAAELHAPEWRMHVSGKLKATSKDDLRRFLKRSPDRADALALSVWEGATMQAPDAPDETPDVDPGTGAINPYAGSINPYA